MAGSVQDLVADARFAEMASKHSGRQLARLFGCGETTVRQAKRALQERKAQVARSEALVTGLLGAVEPTSSESAAVCDEEGAGELLSVLPPLPHEQAQEEALSRLLGLLNAQEVRIEEAICLIGSLSWEGLLALGGYAEIQRKKWWFVRAAAAYEIQERVRARLQMRPSTDPDGQMHRELQQAAEAFGVRSYKTLEIDARCIRDIYAEDIRRAIETGESLPAPILEREYHVIATRADDPKAALAYAENRLLAGERLTTRDFALHVDQQKKAARARQTAKNREGQETPLDDYRWRSEKSFPVSDRALSNIHRICSRLQADLAATITWLSEIGLAATEDTQAPILIAVSAEAADRLRQAQARLGKQTATEALNDILDFFQDYAGA
jgi:hypothetical protein